MACGTPDPEYWVPYGYVVIRVDQRGSGKSSSKLVRGLILCNNAMGSFSRAATSFSVHDSLCRYAKHLRRKTI